MNQQEKIKRILMKAKNDPAFFAEKFLIGKKGPLILEEQQKHYVNDKSPLKVFLASRRSGKSVAISVDILHNLFFNKNYSIVCLSPTQKQSKEIATNFGDIVKRSPLVQSSLVTDNRFEKSLTNLSRVNFSTSGSASGSKENSGLVGTSPDYLISDEAQSISDEAFGVIIPAAAGQGGDVKLAFCGTPRGRAGTFYEVIQNSKYLTEFYNNDFKKVINDKGQYSLHRFQVVTLNEDGDILESRSPRVSVDELETIKQTIGLEKFRREFGLQFLDSSSIVFYDSLIEEQGILDAPLTFSSKNICVGGIDLGKQRNNTVLSIAEYVNNKWEMKYVKSWPIGTKYKLITHYIKNVLPVKFPNFCTLCVDKTGVGNAFIESLEDISRFDVEGVIFSQPSKVGLVESLVRNLEEDVIKFYPEKKLIKEMKQYTRDITENDNVIYTKGESDDFVDSFLLCNAAATSAVKNGYVYSFNKFRRSPTVSSLGFNSFEQTKNYTGGLRGARLNRKSNDNPYM